MIRAVMRARLRASLNDGVTWHAGGHTNDSLAAFCDQHDVGGGIGQAMIRRCSSATGSASAVASVGERDGSGSLDLPPPLRTRVLSRTDEEVDSIGLLVF